MCTARERAVGFVLCKGKGCLKKKKKTKLNGNVASSTCARRALFQSLCKWGFSSSFRVRSPSKRCRMRPDAARGCARSVRGAMPSPSERLSRRSFGPCLAAEPRSHRWGQPRLGADGAVPAARFLLAARCSLLAALARRRPCRTQRAHRGQGGGG